MRADDIDDGDANALAMRAIGSCAASAQRALTRLALGWAVSAPAFDGLKIVLRDCKRWRELQLGAMQLAFT